MKKICFLPLCVACFIGACTTHEPEPLYMPQVTQVDEQDEARYRDNIVLKQHGPDFVTYEYRNVRIDELAAFAVNYCLDNAPGKKAYLREIVMRENHSKFATFDCIDLQ